MKHWSKIEVGDLVRCVIAPRLGLGIVLEIKHFNAGPPNVKCYWADSDSKFTYFADELKIVEEK